MCQKLNCPQDCSSYSEKYFEDVSFLTRLHPHPTEGWERKQVKQIQSQYQLPNLY
ncbi:hypothetical protein NIES4072_40970 [Nostoc commune NIES-4072]|uniref:Uncharacterized protein n=1 Tax=Nostoc commune NIES-4072 TaxID=2005467 RepID=A0A2R5FQW6_NOSCO|nr:hypothetical protein NIES4070_49880 [Nostoc commune HK-02]GBG20419.1 hypothetical protein NIES4072_40970 [Nostoc commune NIES-4072]